MRPFPPEASAAWLPPPLLRLLPGGAIQFPGGPFIPLWTSAFHGALQWPVFASYSGSFGNARLGLLLASPLGTDFYCLEICPSIVGVPDVNKLQYRLLLLLRHFVGYLRSKETLHAAKSCFIFGR
jgi:hypothetical protein